MKLTRLQFLSTSIAALAATTLSIFGASDAPKPTPKAKPSARQVPPCLAKLKEEVERLGFEFFWEQRAYIVEFFAYGTVLYRNKNNADVYGHRVVTMNYCKDVDLLSSMAYPQVFVSEMIKGIRDAKEGQQLHPELAKYLEPMNLALPERDCKIVGTIVLTEAGRTICEMLAVKLS